MSARTTSPGSFTATARVLLFMSRKSRVNRGTPDMTDSYDMNMRPRRVTGVRAAGHRIAAALIATLVSATAHAQVGRYGGLNMCRLGEAIGAAMPIIIAATFDDRDEGFPETRFLAARPSSRATPNYINSIDDDDLEPVLALLCVAAHLEDRDRRPWTTEDSVVQALDVARNSSRLRRLLVSECYGSHASWNAQDIDLSVVTIVL